MSLPVARIGDSFSCGDTVAMGSGSVFANGLPVARLGDFSTGHGMFPPVPITSGSGSVFADGLPLARLGDPLSPHPHGGVISSGSGSVFSG